LILQVGKLLTPALALVYRVDAVHRTPPLPLLRRCAEHHLLGATLLLEPRMERL
jgi:hypothetical protein